MPACQYAPAPGRCSVKPASINRPNQAGAHPALGAAGPRCCCCAYRADASHGHHGHHGHGLGLLQEPSLLEDGLDLTAPQSHHQRRRCHRSGQLHDRTREGEAVPSGCAWSNAPAAGRPTGGRGPRTRRRCRVQGGAGGRRCCSSQGLLLPALCLPQADRLPLLRRRLLAGCRPSASWPAAAGAVGCGGGLSPPSACCRRRAAFCL